mmetsp:Transcript_1150/g.2415  ORF Transcript_1150/g.2415 Transcript_1150/m.2415 type:complete len:381 (+) Transcript_1150:414-1556(+)
MGPGDGRHVSLCQNHGGRSLSAAFSRAGEGDRLADDPCLLRGDLLPQRSIGRGGPVLGIHRPVAGEPARASPPFLYAVPPSDTENLCLAHRIPVAEHFSGPPASGPGVWDAPSGHDRGSRPDGRGRGAPVGLDRCGGHVFGPRRDPGQQTRHGRRVCLAVRGIGGVLGPKNTPAPTRPPMQPRQPRRHQRNNEARREPRRRRRLRLPCHTNHPDAPVRGVRNRGLRPGAHCLCPRIPVVSSLGPMDTDPGVCRLRILEEELLRCVPHARWDSVGVPAGPSNLASLSSGPRGILHLHGVCEVCLHADTRALLFAGNEHSGILIGLLCGRLCYKHRNEGNRNNANNTDDESSCCAFLCDENSSKSQCQRVHTNDATQQHPYL